MICRELRFFANRRTLASAVAASLVLAGAGFSETSDDKEPRFEVASVKAAPPEPGLGPMGNLRPRITVEERLRMSGGPGTKDPGRIEYSGVTMRMLVRRAYGVRPDQIAGPRWLDDQRYDVVAKVSPGTGEHQLGLMVRSLLSERFQMQIHREKKTMSVYALVVAKDGPKVQPAETVPSADSAAPQGGAMLPLRAMEPGISRFHESQASVAELIDALSRAVDRQVVDRTELKGNFSFTLRYQRETAPGRADSDAHGDPRCLKLLNSSWAWNSCR
jgi:uncharacterized protein (TIGR03435 family)